MREGDAADAPEFLDRLRADDARAFEELVASHQHRVFGVALRMLGGAAEAEEVAQEAFLRAQRAEASYLTGGINWRPTTSWSSTPPTTGAT